MASHKFCGSRLLPAIGALGWFFLAVLPAEELQASTQNGSCELHQLVSLNLDISASGGIFVPVEINKTPAFMYLEIGSPFSMLSLQAASRFKLPKTELGKGIEIRSATNRIQQYTDTDIVLGEIAFPQAHFLLDPQSETSSRYSRPEVIGILGIDLLWKMDLELDLGNRRLNLYEHSHCGTQVFSKTSNYMVVPLQRDAFGNMFFAMELDGRRLETLLTTGSPRTTLSTDVTRRVYGFDKSSVGIESVTDKEGHTTSQYRAMKLTASGLTLTDERVRLTDPPSDSCHLARKGSAIGYSGCLYQYPLRLGSDTLSRLHVYLATGDNVMYYVANAAGEPH